MARVRAPAQEKYFDSSATDTNKKKSDINNSKTSGYLFSVFRAQLQMRELAGRTTFWTIQPKKLHRPLIEFCSKRAIILRESDSVSDQA